jgi:hypothetical protein
MMRRILVAAAVMVGLAACQPVAVTVTANPSTTAPACKAVTTVTGKLTPKDANREVDLQTQRASDGKWVPWNWFTDASDGLGIIQAPIDKATGNYSLTYLAPQHSSPATTRLRIRTTFNQKDVVSKSWYVTRPSGC